MASTAKKEDACCRSRLLSLSSGASYSAPAADTKVRTRPTPSLWGPLLIPGLPTGLLTRCIVDTAVTKSTSRIYGREEILTIIPVICPCHIIQDLYGVDLQCLGCSNTRLVGCSNRRKRPLVQACLAWSFRRRNVLCASARFLFGCARSTPVSSSHHYPQSEG